MADPSVMFSQPNAGQMFAQGFQQGQEKRRQNMVRGAMAELSRNPDNVKAWEVWNQADPAGAAEYKRQRIAAGREQVKEYQGTMQLASNMIHRMKAANPNASDEQIYTTVRATLLQQGAPGAEMSPQQFDPQYYQGLILLTDPPKQQNGQMISFVPGGGVARYNPQTGQVEMVVIPNDGSHPTGAPGGDTPPPPPGFVLDGDAGGNASGGFPRL